MRCLVTAGNTREAIDSVRMWTNIFTGITGFRIAQALAKHAEVDLLTSVAEHLKDLPSLDASLPEGKGIRGIAFHSHAELREALERLMTSAKYDAVFMTAAVADYKPAGAFAVQGRTKSADGTEQWTVRPIQAAKIKSEHDTIAIVGQRTEKLVDLFRSRWGFQGLLVKFKLEVGLGREQLIEIGQASRRASGADYLVANSLDMISGPAAGAFLLSDHGEEWMPRETLPQHMLALLRR